MRPLGTKGADAPEELVENVFIQNKRAASAWSLLHVLDSRTRHTNGTRVSGGPRSCEAQVACRALGLVLICTGRRGSGALRPAHASSQIAARMQDNSSSHRTDVLRSKVWSACRASVSLPPSRRVVPSCGTTTARLAERIEMRSRMPNVLTARRTAAVNRLRAVSQNGRRSFRSEAELTYGAELRASSRTTRANVSSSR